jgi:ATP-dependent RNA helicase DDX1
MAAFAECGVMPEIIRALDELGWQLPTPIQQEAVPLILGGGDVLGAAETGLSSFYDFNWTKLNVSPGTGKTGAFGIPILQLIHENLRQEAIERNQEGGATRTVEKIVFKMSMEDKEVCCILSPSPLGSSLLKTIVTIKPKYELSNFRGSRYSLLIRRERCAQF